MSKKQPMQSVYLNEHGTARFRPNKIVRYLLDAGIFDMNHIALLPHISKQDREQFAQLIGYSVSGFGDLSYAREKTIAKADRRVEKLIYERNEAAAVKGGDRQ